eukprot:s1191_g23.t1
MGVQHTTALAAQKDPTHLLCKPVPLDSEVSLLRIRIFGQHCPKVILLQRQCTAGLALFAVVLTPGMQE